MSSYLGIAGLLFLGVVLGQPALERADAQSPPEAVDVVGARPKPAENLPSDFIDSRPIVAYFDGLLMPDTVRALLQELKRPDRCGPAAKLRTAEACALVFYKLDDAFTPDRLRPPFIIRAVYRVTDPENPADTVIRMPDGKGDLQSYTDARLFEPLRDIRANICPINAGEREAMACSIVRSAFWENSRTTGKRSFQPNRRTSIFS
jgi:hypothetical protein